MTGKEIFDGLAKGECWLKDKATIAFGRGGSLPVCSSNQHPEEIVWFLEEINDRIKEPRLAVEIGLENGGTHMLFRQIFEYVISVELDGNRVLRFVGGLPSGDTQSKFVVGNSALPGTLRTLCDVIAKTSAVPDDQFIDLLFIDGDHSYASVESDYLNYAPLVRRGGIIAFHDISGRDTSVKTFVGELSSGTGPLGLGPFPVQEKSLSSMGIAYHIKV